MKPKHALVLLVLAASLPAQDSLPTKKQLEDKAIVFERALNLKAFKARYLPVRESLFAKHGGKWIVIASGKLFPMHRDANGFRFLAPATTLRVAVESVDKAAPDAAHRFVFRIGEDADFSYDLGMSSNRNVVGGGFLSVLPGDAILSGKAILTRWKKRPLTLKLQPGRGFVLRSLLRSPLGDKKVSAETVDFAVSTVLTGISVLSADQARKLELHRWEIPGTVKMKGVLQSGTLRRARMQFRFQGTEFELTAPVSIWKK